MQKNDISFYIVGGAVRDALLGKEPHDYDIVVEGAIPEKMKDLGFIQVGKSFPVFLHPVTKMEFALCRKEVKTGNKHTDFEFVWDNVTLLEDLERRDFTINAMACACTVFTNTGEIIPITISDEKKIENCYIIDHHYGRQDLYNKIIRNNIFRNLFFLGRFICQFFPGGFFLAPICFRRRYACRART